MIDVRRDGRATSMMRAAKGKKKGKKKVIDVVSEERRKSYMYITLYVYYIERWGTSVVRFRR